MTGETCLTVKIWMTGSLKYTTTNYGDNYANTFRVVDGKPLKEGFIALQSEGHGVEFKNIKIKKLK